jgi:aminoglycoside phosphotransferase (APT) family kinase protein
MGLNRLRQAALEFFLGNLQAYLTERLGRGVVVQSVQRFPRGTSRETWFVSLNEGHGDTPETLVFRTDLSAGSFDATSLDREYFLYERLKQTQVPVARTLWWEDDPRCASRPFYVREHIEGDWNVPHFSDPDPAYDELRIAISREHMRKLALVHNVDWRALGIDAQLPAPKSVADCAGNYVRTIREQFESVRVEGIPVCLCKGTNGFGEEVFREHTIVAMSDWEEASIGDPAADFAFMQNFAPEIVRNGERLWGLDRALAYYREVSGIDIPLASVQYYGVLRALRLLVTCHKAAAGVGRRAADVRRGWTGTEVAHLMKRILGASMGWFPPPSAQRMLELNATVDSP